MSTALSTLTLCKSGRWGGDSHNHTTQKLKIEPQMGNNGLLPDGVLESDNWYFCKHTHETICRTLVTIQLFKWLTGPVEQVSFPHSSSTHKLHSSQRTGGLFSRLAVKRLTSSLKGRLATWLLDFQFPCRASTSCLIGHSNSSVRFSSSFRLPFWWDAMFFFLKVWPGAFKCGAREVRRTRLLKSLQTKNQLYRNCCRTIYNCVFPS